MYSEPNPAADSVAEPDAAPNQYEEAIRILEQERDELDDTVERITKENNALKQKLELVERDNEFLKQNQQQLKQQYQQVLKDKPNIQSEAMEQLRAALNEANVNLGRLRRADTDNQDEITRLRNELLKRGLLEPSVQTQRPGHAPRAPRVSSAHLRRASEDSNCSNISFATYDSKREANAADVLFPEFSNQASNLAVRVLEPVLKGEGIRSYTVYTIKSSNRNGRVNGLERLNLSGEHTVYRRFKDFVWLRNQFKKSNKGVIIPQLPEKTVYGRFQDRFIERRRWKLEVFLNNVLQNHHLCKSSDLATFLSADTLSLEQAKTRNESQSRELGDVVSEFFTSVSNRFGSGRHQPKSFEDLKCVKAQEYAILLKGKLERLFKTTQEFIRRTNSLADAWLKFGVSFSDLGEFEKAQEEPGLGEVLGPHCDQLSSMYRDMAQKANTLFGEPLLDYIRLLRSVQEMMRTREAALLTHQTRTKYLVDAQNKLADLVRSNANEDKIAGLRADIPEIQERVDEAREHLDSITERAFSEVKRFKQTKVRDIHRMIYDIVKLQIDHAKNIQETWTESVLPELASHNNSVTPGGI